MNGIVIGIVGKAGVGKDSLADHLIEQFGVVKHGFSYALKNLVAHQFGYDFDRLNDPNEREYKEAQDPNLPDGWTRRRVMQRLGMVFRDIDPDHWVKRGMHAVNGLLRDGVPGVVLTDVRFMNEAAAIRALPGGYLWKVECPDMVPALTGEAAEHVSETELEQIVPHVTMRAAFGFLSDLYAQGNMVASSIGLQPRILGR